MPRPPLLSAPSSRHERRTVRRLLRLASKQARQLERIVASDLFDQHERDAHSLVGDALLRLIVDLRQLNDRLARRAKRHPPWRAPTPPRAFREVS